MKMRITFKIISTAVLALPALAALWPATARADRRAYAETYEAVTAPRGELDVETWSTYATDGEVPNGPAGAVKGFRNMLELEYGLTDRWDVALYNLLDTDTSTGQTGYAGVLVTKTLVVAGETRVTTTSAGRRGAMMRAYDKTTGQEVGAVYMPAPQSGSPMTYQFNGKQYLVVAVSGGNYSGELLAFKLPG